MVGELTVELKATGETKPPAPPPAAAAPASVCGADAEILPVVRELKAEHPFCWDYRRVWAHLRFIKALPVNQKRVYRLSKENNLLVEKNRRLRAVRENQPARGRVRAARISGGEWI